MSGLLGMMQLSEHESDQIEPFDDQLQGQLVVIWPKNQTRSAQES